MSVDSNKKIRDGKEALVLEFVKTIKDKYELDKKLTVVFCDGFTPMGQEALACIEPATGTIYISRIYLNKMGIDEIKKVVAHEITHMFETEHTPAFYKLLNEFLSATWEPDFSTGIISINGSGRVEKPVKKKKEVIDKTVCNRHSCNISTNLKRCRHCRGYYCEEHITPLPPSLPNFDYPNKFNEWKQRRESHHPCPPFYDYLVRKHKENTKAASESLDRMNVISKKPAITVSEETKKVKKEIGKHIEKEKELTEKAPKKNTELKPKKPSSMKRPAKIELRKEEEKKRFGNQPDKELVISTKTKSPKREKKIIEQKEDTKKSKQKLSWWGKRQMEKEKKWILHEMHIHPHSFILKDRIADFQREHPDEKLETSAETKSPKKEGDIRQNTIESFEKEGRDKKNRCSECGKRLSSKDICRNLNDTSKRLCDECFQKCLDRNIYGNR